MNAQEDGIRFGAKAGVNIANVTGDDADDDADSKIGFHLGAVVEIPVSESFALQPELLFSSQGVDETTLSYINIPVMAKYYVSEGLSLQAGPQVGILVAADFDGQDIKDDLKTIDFGINLGAGYQLESGIFFDARYNLGLSSIDDFDFDVKNSVIQVSVGYKF